MQSETLDNLNEIEQLRKIISEKDQIIIEQNKKINSLEHIINLIPCNIYWKDKNDYYLGCNESNLRAVGCKSLQDFVGKKTFELLPKLYANKIKKIDEEILRTGQGKILEENGRDMKGEPAIYLSHKIPLLDKNNNVIGLLGVSFDITQRKKVELELKETKEIAEKQCKISTIYLNNLIASLPENFYWKDKDGKAIACNENQARLVGLTTKEFLGKNIFDLGRMLGWNENIAKTINENDQEVMQTKKSTKTEEIIFLNGEKRTFLSYKNPMLDDKNKVIGLFGIGIDITDRKRIEEELRIAKEKAELANQAKSEFITNMSHDIRTPFSGILGFTKILLKKETNPEKKEMLQDIIQSSEKLLILLNQILDLAKANNKNISSVVKFNLQESIDQVTQIMLAEIHFKKLKLHVEIDKNLSSFIAGDKLKFDRIVLNLLSNAVKFTTKGHILIKMACISQTAEKIILQLTVEDSGIGIPADKYQTIFEHFSRLTPAHEGNYQGSGLGLYMVKQYVDQMEGTISVVSELGKGSTFTCQLPFKYINKDKSANSDGFLNSNEEVQKTNSRFSPFITKPSKYILLIEDDIITQKISKIILQEHCGCLIDIAENGERALEKLIVNHYDLILLDIGLPDINGFHLAKKIRTLNEHYAKIPIFGLTAHADETWLTSTTGNAINKILIKPLSEEVCATIFNKN